MSPLLFKALASGSHFKSAVLAQRNLAGDPMAVWVLETVFLTFDGTHGDLAAAPNRGTAHGVWRDHGGDVFRAHNVLGPANRRWEALVRPRNNGATSFPTRRPTVGRQMPGR